MNAGQQSARARMKRRTAQQRRGWCRRPLNWLGPHLRGLSRHGGNSNRLRLLTHYGQAGVSALIAPHNYTLAEKVDRTLVLDKGLLAACS